MKRNQIYIILVLLLAVIFGYLKYKQDASAVTTEQFNIDNVDDIAEIQFTDKIGTTVKLTKKNGVWYVNDTIPAQRPKVLLLLETLNKLQVEYPIGENQREIALDNLRKYAIKVEAKDEKGREIRTIYMGNSYNNKGNYMILSENGIVSPQPYLVRIPGEPIDIPYRFSMEYKNWRSKEVFAVKLDRIKNIKVTYLDKPQYSFNVAKDEDLIKITPSHDSLTNNNPVDREKVLNFLLAFELVNMDAQIDDDSVKQIIKELPSFATIEVEDVKNQKNLIKLYRKPNPRKFDQFDKAGKPIPFDLDNYWAYIPSKNQYAIVQYYIFGPILRDYEYFFKQPAPKQ